MSVLVFVEIKNKLSKAAKEAITYGKNLGEVNVVTYGNASDEVLSEMGDYGAKNIFVYRKINEPNDQVISKLILKAVEKLNAEFILLSQDQTGKSIGPRVAAKLEAGHISGAISLPEVSDEFTVKTNVYSGKAIAYVCVHSDKKVISILPNSIQPEENKVDASISEFDEDLGNGRIKTVDLKPLGDGIPLPEAELVVSAGRGLKGPDKWLKQTIGDGYVMHSFRHSMRDRLRSVNCPSEMIDQIGGWSKTSVGEGYGEGFRLTQVFQALLSLSLKAKPNFTTEN